MSDLAVGPSRAMGDGFTDGGISKGERLERELVAWTTGEDDPSDPSGGLLEDPAKRASNHRGGGGGGGGGANGGGAWDQFAANKNMFGVDTTFDESMYTTSIDRSKGGISEREAARIAHEIQARSDSHWSQYDRVGVVNAVS